MLTWVVKNPIKSACAIGIAAIYLRRRAKRPKYYKVYQRLVSGSRPDLHQPDMVIPRPQIEQDMTASFLPKTDNMFHDIITGPSGSGKTHAVRQLCNKHPKGVLYFEVTYPDEFVAGLSQEIGIKKTHSEVLDLISRCHGLGSYLLLPPNQSVGLMEVLKVVECVATHYREETGEIPVLFIDGIDRLIEYDEELYRTLVRAAKYCANCGILNLILVGSERDTMIDCALKDEASALLRALVYEVGDVDSDEAWSYLMHKHGFSQDTAKKLVNCIGGRLEYLVYPWGLKDEILNSDDISHAVTSALFPFFGMNQEKLCILERKPESTMILRKIIDDGSISTKDLCDMDGERVLKVAKDMIDAKIIRRDKNHQIVWYSKVHEHELSKLVK